MADLTDRAIRAAKCPEGLNQHDLPDGKIRGLTLRVDASGSKAWALHYGRREDNRRRRLTLGSYPGVSLKHARELAIVALGQIAAGEDPQGEREEVRARGGRDSVVEVAADYLERYSKPNKRAAGYEMNRVGRGGISFRLDRPVVPKSVSRAPSSRARVRTEDRRPAISYPETITLVMEALGENLEQGVGRGSRLWPTVRRAVPPRRSARVGLERASRFQPDLTTS